MYSNGILVLTNGLSRSYLCSLYGFARGIVNNKLYITLNALPYQPKNISEWSRVIATCYSLAAEKCPNLDVRLLLPSPKRGQYSWNVTIVDNVKLNHQSVVASLHDIADQIPKTIVYSDINFNEDDNLLEDSASSVWDPVCENPVENACLGGTFDNLHAGHKILLSCGSICCSNMLTIGITQQSMLMRKTLSELIEPIEIRSKRVKEFLEDIRPGLHYNISPLNDPFGPPAHDADYQVIVGSPETIKNCEKLNEIRVSKNFPPLAIRLIELADDKHRETSIEEEKISSSSQRIRLLGTLLREPNSVSGLSPQSSEQSPYIIGLTGGICSGKSVMGRRMSKLGVATVDCDKLGHLAYKPGTECYQQVIKTFGQSIVNASTKEIDRRLLGSIVFKDQEKLSLLNSIVWPEILKQIKLKVQELQKSGHKIIVIEAAVLLQAGWDSICHEVWTTFIPHDEAIKRMVERDNLSSSDAQSRIDRQLSNREIISRSHVIFCTLWEEEITQKQLDKAWTLLSNRLVKSNNTLKTKI